MDVGVGLEALRKLIWHAKLDQKRAVLDPTSSSDGVSATRSVASTHVNIGNLYQAQGNYEKALFHCYTAIPVLISQMGQAHGSVADTYVTMGIVQRKLGIVQRKLRNLQKALELYQMALEIQLKCFGGAHVSVADTLFNMSMIDDNIGDESKGLELTRRAHSIQGA